nr:ATP-dependent zinc metalloprotease FtsH [[Mycoplasma] testudinis]
MAKAKANSGEKITESKMDPRRKRSIIISTIIWLVIIGIIIALIVVATLPGTPTVSISDVRWDGTNLSALINNASSRSNINLGGSSFATAFTNANHFNIALNIGGNNVFVSGDFISGSTINTGGAQPVVTIAGQYQIANLIIDKAAGTITITGQATPQVFGPAAGQTSVPAQLTRLFAIGTVATPNTTGAIIGNVVITLIPLIFYVIIFYFIYRFLRRGMGGLGGGGGGDGEGTDNVFTIGKSQAKLAKSTVRFADVAGIEEEKNELIEIVDYLKNPGRYAQMGARSPRGVILYGPPGTGKTLLAKAVAGEAGVPFFQVTGSAFEDMLVGVGAKRVRDLFNKAKKAAPCIIFIDEIDSVGSKRGKLDVSNYSVAEQTLNQLLAEMDGFSSRTGVVVMAATNRLDVLDDALLRPGRFDRHIQVSLPDVKERTAILKIHAVNKNLSSKVNLEDIARRTPGFSGAQLENVLNEATLLAVRAKRNTITMEDLDEAIDRVMAGPAKKSRVMSEQDRKLTAYHEAGHAIVGLHLKGADEVQKITIIPRGQAGGYTLSTPKDAEMLMKRKSDLLNMVAGALGGRAAEEVIFGAENITTGASNDFYKATNIVRAMVTQLGMSRLGMTQFIPSEGAVNPNVKLYSDKTAESIDVVINEIIQKQYEVAKQIIESNREEHELIVQTLLIQETIVKRDIDYIHEHKKMPQGAIDLQKAAEDAKMKKMNMSTDDPVDDNHQASGSAR